MAIALKENITLKSLDLSHNDIKPEGATSIARALTYNPNLLCLKVSYNHYQDFTGLQEFKSTFHNLQGLLNKLLGEDGAQILGIAFHIKSWCVIYDPYST
jgi:Leucine Rich repeat